ncbi:MAG: membrane protein [Cryomorphaceae bacterium]|nr:MAG: membrane protein [Cryomorphaceae bacterium]
MMEHAPIFTNDATVLGILVIVLAFIFYTSSSENPFWKKFYTYIPALLLCYFLPSVLNSMGLISGEQSGLYFMASRYLLPASLVLLTLSVDIKGIINLGPKAIIMFLAGTFGIVIGGPLTVILLSYISPHLVGGSGSDEIWKGLATIAGSWIGGGANQTAMKEMFGCSDKLFSAMITVDVIVANIWMAFLLYGAGISSRVDKWFKADSSSIEALKVNLAGYQSKITHIPNLTDLMIILAIGLGLTGLAHIGADIIAPWVSLNSPELSKFSLTSKFFWLIVIATSGGLILSFTKLKKYEGAGASKVGSVFLYILVATIGMKMDALAILDNPDLFLIGIIWMLIHVSILLAVAKIIKAPFFFVAVGSQANVGGAASAPIVASAFHSSLAPVGVLLAVFGYALGTYAAWFCAILMQSTVG